MSLVTHKFQGVVGAMEVKRFHYTKEGTFVDKKEVTSGSKLARSTTVYPGRIMFGERNARFFVQWADLLEEQLPRVMTAESYKELLTDVCNALRAITLEGMNKKDSLDWVDMIAWANNGPVHIRVARLGKQELYARQDTATGKFRRVEPHSRYHYGHVPKIPYSAKALRVAKCAYDRHKKFGNLMQDLMHLMPASPTNWDRSSMPSPQVLGEAYDEPLLYNPVHADVIKQLLPVVRRHVKRLLAARESQQRSIEQARALAAEAKEG